MPPAQQKSGRSQSNQQQHQKKCPPKRDHRAYRATKRSNVTEERAVATQRNAAAPQIRAAACRPELRLLRRQRRQLPSPTTAAIWDYVLQCESDCCGRCSSSKLLSAVKTIFLRSVRACVRSCFVFAEIEQHQQSARKKNRNKFSDFCASDRTVSEKRPKKHKNDQFSLAKKRVRSCEIFRRFFVNCFRFVCYAAVCVKYFSLSCFNSRGFGVRACVSAFKCVVTATTTTTGPQ